MSYKTFISLTIFLEWQIVPNKIAESVHCVPKICCCTIDRTRYILKHLLVL